MVPIEKSDVKPSGSSAGNRFATGAPGGRSAARWSGGSQREEHSTLENLPAPTPCTRYAPGHAVHHVQARLRSRADAAPCTVANPDGEYFDLVGADGVTTRMWWHDARRVQIACAIGVGEYAHGCLAVSEGRITLPLYPVAADRRTPCDLR